MFSQTGKEDHLVAVGIFNSLGLMLTYLVMRAFPESFFCSIFTVLLMFLYLCFYKLDRIECRILI